jgi:hypothetical protein
MKGRSAAIMADWFYSQNGQQQGPVSLESLRQMAAAGQVRPTDMVWSAGMAAWQPAGQTAGLLPAGATPPPVPIGYASPAPYAGAPHSIGQDAGVRWLLPVGRSGWAIAAGYLGLFCILLVPGPFALACAVIAIRDIRKHPERHGMGRATFGLVMGILGTAVLALWIGLSIFGHWE